MALWVVEAIFRLFTCFGVLFSLSVLLGRFRNEFGERQAEGQQWFSYKLHWSEQRKSVLLVAGPTGLEQKDPGSNKLLASYFYKDLDGIAEVQYFSF